MTTRGSRGGDGRTRPSVAPRDHLCPNLFGVAALHVALATVLISAPASADTFKPTRFDDPKPGKCKTRDCSLREAVRAANKRSGRDKVVLARGTYELARPPTDAADFNADGDLFGKDVTIRGRGPKATRIDANGIDRVLSLGFGLTPKGSILEGVTMKGGDPGANPHTEPAGGGLQITSDKATLRNVVVKGNAAQFGGGIKPRGAALTIRNSTISGNNAGEGGGMDLRAQGIQVNVTVRSSTISGNTANNGGGVMADGTGSPAVSAPILVASNSTIAGNTASASAGGIAGGQNAIVALNHTTVAYNTADSDNTGGGAGGGIHQQNNASFQLNDSVLAVNSVGSSGTGPACHGEFQDGGSLVDATGANLNCNFVGLFQPDTTTVPGVGPLAANGGPTKTIALLAGSPAIGIALNCSGVDQRGKLRPEEGCDAGSFERKGP
jgi:hypothetical protein